MERAVLPILPKEGRKGRRVDQWPASPAWRKEKSNVRAGRRDGTIFLVFAPTSAIGNCEDCSGLDMLSSPSPCDGKNCSPAKTVREITISLYRFEILTRLC